MPLTSGSCLPVSCATCSSIPSTSSSASCARLWMNSQRGLSGTLRRTSRITRPSTTPRPKASRQPTSTADRGRRNGQQSATGRADPVAAVDRPGRSGRGAAGDQLVDRGVDRCVLTADAEPGQEPEQEEPPGGEGERGRRTAPEIDEESDHEQFLAPEPSVSQPKNSAPVHAPEHVEGGGEAADLGRADARDRCQIGLAARRCCRRSSPRGARGSTPRRGRSRSSNAILTRAAGPPAPVCSPLRMAMRARLPGMAGAKRAGPGRSARVSPAIFGTVAPA